MFEKNNYYELEQMKDFLLEATSFGTEGIENMRPVVKAIEDEMDRRENVTVSRLRSLLSVVSLLVLITICGCQTFDGVKGDLHWLTADVEHSQTERK